MVLEARSSRRSFPRSKASTGADATPEKAEKKLNRKGKNGAKEYTGLRRRKVKHESLRSGDRCPTENCRGKLSRLKKPARLVRIQGGAPLGGEIYEKERLRCGLCNEIFTAKSSEGIGEEKYDESAVAMMAILRYGAGMPFYRLEQLQKSLGVPLPTSTQWDVVRKKESLFIPVHEELVRQAAQGKVLHNDDTGMKILDLMKEDRESRSRGDPPDRTGIFTSGIVSVSEKHRVALFFTGRNHAGENLSTVLAERAKEIDPAIQMSDAFSRNVPREFETILCNCMPHARREYVDVRESFPKDCRFVLETLGKFFRNDARAREENLSNEERLAFHREESKRLMAGLRLWSAKQIRERLVEPNSGLGGAIAYMRKHWRKLTRFLFVSGAPLENNICERSLKRAITHRKNSLFYKSEVGARVGDLFMSVIATCQLMEVNPMEYLIEIQKNAPSVARTPSQWLPWNYHETLGGLGEATAELSTPA